MCSLLFSPPLLNSSTPPPLPTTPITNQEGPRLTMLPYLFVSYKEFKDVILFKFNWLRYVRAFIWYSIICAIIFSVYTYAIGFQYIDSSFYMYWYWIHLSIIVCIYFVNTLIIAIFSNVKRDNKNKDGEFIGEIAVLIACHNSEDVLVHTIKNLLYTFLPEQIYVADNNNSPEPLNGKTSDLCKETGVNYNFIPIGNKGNALNKTIDIINPKYKFILTVDDDTLLPEDFCPSRSFFDDERVSSVGFGIKVKDKTSLSEKMADFEYKLNCLRDYSKNGTTNFFIVGIAGIWRREIFHKIISMNPTAVKATFMGKDIGCYEAPHGEDSYNGLISRLLGYKQMMDYDNFVETYAPPRFFFNLSELFSTTKNISGYNSLNHYSQRALRWYRSQLVRGPYELLLFLTYNASSSNDNIFMKVCKQVKYRYNVLWKYVLVYFSVSLILSMLFFIINGFYLKWVIVHGAIYILGVLSNSITNYVIFREREDLQIEKKVIFLYPFFTTYISMCRFAGIIGALTFHIPFRSPFYFSFLSLVKEEKNENIEEVVDVETGTVR